MGLPMLNQMFCGCSVRVGTEIVGWVSVLGYTTYYLGVVTGQMASHFSTRKDLIGVLTEVLIGLNLAASLILLFGVYKARPRYLIPFLVIVGGFALFVITVIIIGIFTPALVGIGESVFGLFTQGVNAYAALIVFSYYIDVKSGSNTSAPGV